MARLASEERYKGIDEVMAVMPELLSIHPHLVYLVVGDGDDRARLENRAETLGISSHMRFTGKILEDEKVGHYRLADAFVMPGRGEGFGIVYLEAMACGVPVVGSLLDGSQEALLDGELGVLVDPEDRRSLISGIDEALQRPRRVPEKLGLYEFGNLVRMLKEHLVDGPRSIESKSHATTESSAA